MANQNVIYELRIKLSLENKPARELHYPYSPLCTNRKLLPKGFSIFI